jgi:hypothetical protein
MGPLIALAARVAAPTVGRAVAGRAAAGAAAGETGAVASAIERKAIGMAMQKTMGFAGQVAASRHHTPTASNDTGPSFEVSHATRSGGSNGNYVTAGIGVIIKQLSAIDLSLHGTNTILTNISDQLESGRQQDATAERIKKNENSWMARAMGDLGKVVKGAQTDASGALKEGLMAAALVTAATALRAFMDHGPKWLKDLKENAKEALGRRGPRSDYATGKIGDPNADATLAPEDRRTGTARPNAIGRFFGIKDPGPAPNPTASPQAAKPIDATSAGMRTALGSRPSGSPSSGSDRVMLDQIGAHEAGGMGYDAYWLGAKKWGMIPTKKVSTMTIGEVFTWQRELLNRQIAAGIPLKKRSSAIGRYQFVYTTLKNIVAKLKLPMSQVFDAATQDRLALFLVDEGGVYTRWKKGEASDAEMADRLANQWASLKDSRGRGQYNDAGFNTASGSGMSVVGAMRSGSTTRSPSSSATAAPVTPPGARPPAQKSIGPAAIKAYFTEALKTKWRKISVDSFAKLKIGDRALSDRMFEVYWNQCIKWVMAWKQNDSIEDAMKGFNAWWGQKPSGGYVSMVQPMIDAWNAEHGVIAPAAAKPAVPAAPSTDSPTQDATPVVKPTGTGTRDDPFIVKDRSSLVNGQVPKDAFYRGADGFLRQNTTVSTNGNPIVPGPGRTAPVLQFNPGVEGQVTDGFTFDPVDRGAALRPAAAAKPAAPQTIVVGGGSQQSPVMPRSVSMLGPNDVPNPSASNIIREYQLYFTTARAA